MLTFKDLYEDYAADVYRFSLWLAGDSFEAEDITSETFVRAWVRIHTIRTDNGHEFQSGFHWHLGDLGIRHVYIKPRTPRLNGKVERSHKTDDIEFYQLLSYRGDIDLNKKLLRWEKFYNFTRPHAGVKGKTPYEVLREKLR